MTYDQAIAKLVDLDVAKWGEQERAASEALNRKNYPTIGLALNRLAHYGDNIDENLAREAKAAFTAADRRALRAGG
jgi:hypothetical protein